MSLHLLFFILLAILLLILLLIAVVIFYSFSKFKELLSEQLWGAVIDEKISSVIIYGADETAANPAFNQRLQNVYFEQLFLEKLVKAERKFSGTAKRDLKTLYERHGLARESLRKLQQKKPHLIVGAIQEMTAMQVESALPQIETFLTHPFHLVYEEAQYSSVHFKGFEGLQFLNDHRTPVSDWQQLRLLLAIPEMPPDAAAQLQLWLGSSNSSVVIFTLRLIRKFKFFPAEPLIQNLWDHDSVSVRCELVKTLQALEESETNPDLMRRFPTQPLPVQTEIMKMLKLSSDPRCLDFFKEELYGHPEPEIKIAAAQALVSLGFTEDLRRHAAQESTPAEINRIINHAIDNN
ncbi:HEAT repeat domain-containing protein [Kaistella palustris]|uniref:HEAT repeat domain-containing protein n=1 Tax=Kaistella palustris TaxID=493376 RepID=UPI000410137E|nr:HEAT repeat domain-containing protein [Kaistella palustris]